MQLQDIIDAWNDQADEYNEWRDLDGEEMAEFTLKHISEQLEEFRPMIDQWRQGRPVVKICYALDNAHMAVLDRIISA